jgi:two-component system cell cycle response regulator DivK
MTPLSAASRRAPHVSRVLIVDPDSATRLLYRDSLRHLGYEVVEAADAREALVHALVHPPSVIVTETQLPVFDGYALCDILRRDSTTRAIPIVVVTAESRDAELGRARAAGANSVLVKPAPIEVIVTEIQRLLAPDARQRPAPDTMAPSPPISAARRRKPPAKAHLRCETTTPPIHPPELHCRSCHGVLRYERSYIGGVSIRHPEQWDEFSCTCGIFEYRHRTRRLRRIH